MAKELIYKVRIDFDSASSKEFGSTVERSAEQAEKSINDATVAQNRFNEAQENAGQSSAAFRKNQSRANQVLFSYGDLLNDAGQFQFGFSNGLRAIGNNVGFAAEGIANLNSKTGGFRGTLKALGSSLLGPGGIILGLNLAVTAFTVFGDAIFDSTEKTKDLNVELKDTGDFLKDIATNRVDEFSKSFEDLTAREGALNQALDSLQEQASTIDRQIEGFQDLTQNANIYNNLTDEQRRTAASTLAELIQQKDETGEINSLAQNLLKNKLAEVEAQRLVNQALQDSLNIQEKVSGQITAPTIEPQRPEDTILEEDPLTELAQSRVDKEMAIFQQRIDNFKAFEDKKTQIQKIAEAQRSQLTVQAISVAGELLGAAFGQSKEFAIAQTLISTYAAAQKAYESQLAIPTPDAPARATAAAAVAVAQGLARLAQIRKASLGGGGSGRGTGGGASRSRQQGFQTSTVERNRDFSAIRNRERDTTVVVEANNILPDTEFSIRSERGRKSRERRAVILSSDRRV